MKRLGTQPVLEKLARRWRTAGGSVEITGGNHIKWIGRSGQILEITGLTISENSARRSARRLERILASWET